MKRIFILSTFAFLLFTCAATATTRFVSKTGSSVPPYTTWETASDSIQKCINICNDGDTVFVANGVYKETLVIDSAIVLIGESMDSTIIDGTGLNGINLTFLTVEILNHVKLKNFNIKGKGILNGVVIRALYEGIIYLDSCFIQNATYGLQIGFNSSKVKNTIIDFIPKWPIFLSGNDSCYIEVSNCIINIPDHNASSPTGITSDFGGHLTITNNIIIIHNHTFSYGINLEGNNNSVNISNNLIYGAAESNFDMRYVYEPSKIENNIFLNRLPNNASGFEPSLSNIVIRNNLSQGNNVGIQLYTSGYNIDYNLFWNNNNNINGGTITGTHNLTADPMFMSDSISYTSANYDYRLQKYSPAIDAGDPNILDVDGTRSDIGMFGGPLGEEYNYFDIAPRPPVNLTVSIDSGLITLTWNKNTEADFSRYRLYGDTTNNFLIDSTKLISEQTDTFYIGKLPYRSDKYYYKLTAVDNQNNQSKPGEEIEIILVNISEEKWNVVDEYRLYQNYPNPFNSSTTISYKLIEPGKVKLILYSLQGELISTLVNENKSAGYYEERVDFGKFNLSSGVYFYRLETEGNNTGKHFTQVKKAIYLK